MRSERFNNALFGEITVRLSDMTRDALLGEATMKERKLIEESGLHVSEVSAKSAGIWFCQSRLYENAPRLYSSPSTGEGGVGVIFILRCAPPGHAR